MKYKCNIINTHGDMENEDLINMPCLDQCSLRQTHIVGKCGSCTKHTFSTAGEQFTIGTEVKSKDWCTMTFQGGCKPLVGEDGVSILLPVRVASISSLLRLASACIRHSLSFSAFKVLKITTSNSRFIKKKL